MVSVGNRVEARIGEDKVIAFHGTPEKCLTLALTRIEEDRLKKLPYAKDGEPDLIGTLPSFLDRKANGIVTDKPKPGIVVNTAAKAPAMPKTATSLVPASVPVPPAKKAKAEKKAKAPKIAKPPVVEEPIIVPGVVAADDAAQKQIKGSIIKSKYKERYKKHGMSCGDDVADELKAYVTVTANGRQQMDMAKLKKVAEINGVWKPSYGSLNNGQARMTVGNRLRARYEAGDPVDFDGPVLKKEFKD